MIIWTFITTNISKIGMGLFGIIGIFLMGRNSKLAQENENLKATSTNQDKIIDIQQKVIDATTNKDTTPTDLDGNIKRMQNNKL